jgi:hypothetical protein
MMHVLLNSLSYGFRLKACMATLFGVFAGISIVSGPPVEEGMSFDEVWLVRQDAAALTENFVEVLQCLEVFIDNGLVRQRPQAFRRLDLRRI